MKDLIEALQIFAKYADEYSPTHCEHDELMVPGIAYEEVSAEDRERLEVLSFYWSDEYSCWSSFRFGSA